MQKLTILKGTINKRKNAPAFGKTNPSCLPAFVFIHWYVHLHLTAFEKKHRTGLEKNAVTAFKKNAVTAFEKNAAVGS